jgi:hypothetical protein
VRQPDDIQALRPVHSQAVTSRVSGQFGARVPLLADAASYLAIAGAGLLIRTRRGGASASTGVDATEPIPSRRLTQDRLLRTMTLATAGTLTGSAPST